MCYGKTTKVAGQCLWMMPTVFGVWMTKPTVDKDGFLPLF